LPSQHPSYLCLTLSLTQNLQTARPAGAQLALSAGGEELKLRHLPEAGEGWLMWKSNKKK